MNLRKFVLTLHLYLGLTAGTFLVILGLTGSVMALEEDIPHWLHPGLWYVTEGRHRLPENDLVSIAQNQLPGGRVFIVQFPRSPNLAQVMQMTDGTIMYLNPYDGTVLGRMPRRSNTEMALFYIRQVHLRLIPDPAWFPKFADAGKIVVSIAGLLLCLLVPTGVALWWRDKRWSIHWNAADFKVPWFQVFHDAHHAIGVYVALFLMIAAVTGVLIGFDFGPKILYAITKSSPPVPAEAYSSTVIPGATPIMSDQALEIARGAMPDASVAIMVMPVRPTGSYAFLMRLPEENTPTVHSAVTVDQYSGKVIHVRNYRYASSGYQLIRLNRSIHTGEVFGFPSRILASLSSLMLAVLVITGMVVWRKKLVV